LRDPGYSTTGGQITLLGYREIGAPTLIGAVSYVGATFRQLTIGAFAPFVCVIAERNRSTVELFDYRRLRGEIAIVRAFLKLPRVVGLIRSDRQSWCDECAAVGRIDRAIDGNLREFEVAPPHQ
jgi:hypothetical protein